MTVGTSSSVVHGMLNNSLKNLYCQTEGPRVSMCAAGWKIADYY